MKRSSIYLSSICLLIILLTSFRYIDDAWGFFGHRRINRLAVFTLPPPMMHFFKANIDYITEHAIDPDKRRYATRHEAVRHYIDLDEYGSLPFDNVPRKWLDALACFSDIYLTDGKGDTLQILSARSHDFRKDSVVFDIRKRKITTPYITYRKWFQSVVLPEYYEDDWIFDVADFSKVFDDSIQLDKYTKVIVKDRFSEHGILPYHLVSYQHRLTEAFKKMDAKMILRIGTDFGHYIGDAHVPLHTTKNYNGQFTNQDGIHAFWESRVPELFADTEFDFFVGKAEYISDVESYYWDVVLTSHAMVDSVLAIEMELRKTFPQDMQMCFDNRLGRVVRTQCRAFAEAYHKALQGQIEGQFRASILAIGSAWYTAWVDAGQPDLRKLGKKELNEEERAQLELEDKLTREGAPLGRPHDN